MDAEDELELQTTDDPNIQDSGSFVPVVARKITASGSQCRNASQLLVQTEEQAYIHGRCSGTAHGLLHTQHC